MIKFKTIVNPFTQSILVSARVNKVSCETVINYESLDEWSEFVFEGKTFDIHILYEGELTISIYEITGLSVADYQAPQPVDIKVVHKDEF